MNFLESLRLALTSISINKMRSFLTMLGIIIGISSVITITTIGNSLKQTLSSTMNDLGGANLMFANVEPYYPEDDEDFESWEFPDMTEDNYVTDEDITSYKQEFAGRVKAVLLDCYLCDDATFRNGNRSAKVSMTGITSGYLDTQKLTIVRGRDLTDEDYAQKKHAALVSDLFVKYALEEDEEPIGREITLSTEQGDAYDLVIAGVYHYDRIILGGEKGKAEREYKTPIFLPASTANQLSEFPEPGYTSLNILSADGVDPTELSFETEEFFTERITGDDGAFHLTCMDMASELSTINKVLDVITVAISVIAAISLVVGGVGVMNIMLVSIMERTKEIGIRKALGAKNSSIRMQFLTEAVTICLIGGLIGILIGVSNGYLLGVIVKTVGSSLAEDYMSLLTITVRPSLTAILIAVAFSMLTGIIFGSYPASRAAKMSPIDALRYE